MAFSWDLADSQNLQDMQDAFAVDIWESYNV